MSKVLVVCGPTASGKTSLAVELALQLHTEIISADSMLVYRDLNIGTAKPTIQERKGILHHMIDVASPFDSYSVSDYEKGALPIVRRLLAEGKMPILCGGTGFFIRSVLYASQFGNTAADPTIRAEYEKLAAERGAGYLHARLAQVDPESAAVLHENDVKRVIRALEIFALTGRKKSDQNDAAVPRFDFVAVALAHPREELYARIERRVDEMFAQGLVEEVKGLLSRGVTERQQCMQGIGYKEVLFGLQNGQSEDTMSDIIKKNTRNYAKRQITFFKKLEHLSYLEPNAEAVERALELLQ